MQGRISIRGETPWKNNPLAQNLAASARVPVSLAMGVPGVWYIARRTRSRLAGRRVAVGAAGQRRGPPVRPAKTKTAAAALRWYAARRGSVIDGRKRPGARRRLPHHSRPRPNNHTASAVRSCVCLHPLQPAAPRCRCVGGKVPF